MKYASKQINFTDIYHNNNKYCNLGSIKHCIGACLYGIFRLKYNIYLPRTRDTNNESYN